MIPFLTEFIFVFICIFYLFFCAGVVSTTNNITLIFKFILFFKKVIVFLIFLSFLLIFNFPLNIITSFFFEAYLLNNFALNIFKFFFLVLCFIVISQFLNFVYKFPDYWNDFKLYPIFFIGCFFFLLLLFSTYNLLLTTLCILGMSICFHVILLGHMSFGKLTRETIIKYFLFSALSTGFILGGLKDIYACCGTLQYNKINNCILNLVIDNSILINQFSNVFIIKFAIILILCGFFFKLSAFPSHFWAPEVYDGIPFILISFIVIPTKFSLCLALLKIIKYIFILPFSSFLVNFLFLNEIDLILIFVIIFSIFLGGILAFKEKRIKRFIAYSSINQIGFLLIGLLGYNATFFSLQAFLYFLFVYAFNLLVLLSLIMFYVYKINILINTNNSELGDLKLDLNYISDLKYIFWYFQTFAKIFPLLYNFSIFFWLSFILVIFSLAGIPPLLGFYSKFYILLYAFQYQYWFIFLLGIVMSIIGAFYYLRFLKVIFFEKIEISSIEEEINLFNTTLNLFENATIISVYYLLNLEIKKFWFFYLSFFSLFIFNFLLLSALFFDSIIMQFFYIIIQYIVLH